MSLNYFQRIDYLALDVHPDISYDQGEYQVMETAGAMSPAITRVLIRRLLAWLPVGPVVLMGEIPEKIHEVMSVLGKHIAHVHPDKKSTAIIFLRSKNSFSQLAALLQGHLGSIVLVVAEDALASGARDWWEAQAIKSEWRKHPRYGCLAPYGELDTVQGLLLMAFERVPVASRKNFPLEILIEERDLHTDMTREPGRRSDAHMARYTHAAEFVPERARVIDVACGLGYGSYILAHCSSATSILGLDASDFAVRYANSNFANASPLPIRFSEGDAQDLSSIVDASVDFAVSVETMEHLPEPNKLLSELWRVLVPGGAVYASVPNDWSDETGQDPNPFHFHVYDWPRLKAQFERNGFAIEKAWLQDAGGGQKRNYSVRSMLELDCCAGPATDGEWLLVLARKRLSETSLGTTGFSGIEEDPVHVSAKNGLVAFTGGDQTAARGHWLASWQALIARGDVIHIETNMALARFVLAGLDSLQRGSKDISWLLAQDAQVLRHVLGESTALLVSNKIGASDLLDRALIEAPQIGAERTRLRASEVQQLQDAKDWLDGQYKSLVSRVAELECHNQELEAGRRWLDDQYHALTAELDARDRAGRN